MIRFLNILSILFLTTFCDEEEDRQEVVNKLRAIGIKVEPQSRVTLDTKSVDLTAYALVPKGELVTVQNYEDPGASKFSQSLITVVDPNSIQYQDLANFQIVSVQAKASLPFLPPILFEYGQGVIRARYGLRMESGVESENMVGDILIVEKDSEALDWEQPTVEILQPTKDTEFKAGQTIEIEAKFNDVALRKDLRSKVGWYVSGGKVKTLEQEKLNGNCQKAVNTFF